MHRLWSIAFASFLVACSSSTPSGADAGADSGVQPQDDAGMEASMDDTGVPDNCMPAPMTSKCMSSSSWVRGIATWDPKHFMPGQKAVMHIALRHGFIIDQGEDLIGGRLHAYVNKTIFDTQTGQLAFQIDMCMYGTAMWSEENDSFNLVVHIDENGNNDLLQNQSPAPDPGELVKLTKVDVSCNAPPSCHEITLDCKAGTSCTTITPLASCTKKMPGCNSDSIYCQ